MPKEQDAFEDDFQKPEDTDPFATEEQAAVAPEKEEEPQKPEPRENRQVRRLKEKLQAERESAIAMAERIKVLSETKQFKQDTGDLDEDLSRIYGTETPEAREATRILQQALSKVRDEATSTALERFEARQAKANAERVKEESYIDSELEALEDDFNVDLTSNTPAARKARTELLELVQKLSPKDSDGNIKDYADFSEAFEIYQSRRDKPDTTKNKDIAARGMTKSGSGPTKNLEQTANEQYLRDLGII